MAPETRKGTKSRPDSNALGASGDTPLDQTLPEGPVVTHEIRRAESRGKGTPGEAAAGGAETKATRVEGVVSDAITNSDDSKDDSLPRGGGLPRRNASRHGPSCWRVGRGPRTSGGGGKGMTRRHPRRHPEAHLPQQQGTGPTGCQSPGRRVQEEATRSPQALLGASGGAAAARRRAGAEGNLRAGEC